MIENRNIICIASNYWYDPTSKHHVMNLLAERNHVIWVNYHGSRRPTASVRDFGAIVGKLRQIVQGPRRVHENLTVVTPLVVPMPGSDAAADINATLLTRQIRSVLRTLPKRPVQLWSFAPDIDYLCGRFDEEAILYYCVDEFSQFTGYDAGAILESERHLAARADLTVVTSQQLLATKRPISRRILHVPHGVDVEHFAKAMSDGIEVPGDIASLPKPVLGFWGLIQDWVDIDLLASVAEKRPKWTIALIGDAATDASRLAALKNVHLLGRRPYNQLPAYAAGIDIGLIPFRINELTRAVNPIKLREYLSAGLPVVSTPLPEVACYANLVSIAADTHAFVEACEKSVNETRPQKQTRRTARLSAMQTEAWPAKVDQISAELTQAIATKHTTAA
ncbi:MAG: glycosyltransferase [Phycisphaerales bacterium]|nr:glycosyltransferase [Phycisphaerales bacterium]MCB9863397.1 glycosyltransferase [Phycisphaerales bacterium]